MTRSEVEQVATVVIATVGRPDCVIACVRRLAETGVPPTVEVLVVDAGKENPVDPVELARVWPNSRVIRSEVRNAGIQRNTGVKCATHDIVVFLDDDCLVQPGWWPAIVEPLWVSEVGGRKSEVSDQGSVVRCQRPTIGGLFSVFSFQFSAFPPGGAIGAVAGAVWCNPNPTFTDRRGGYVNPFGVPVQVTHRSVRAPRWVDWPMTTNMAVRRCVMDEIGGIASVYGVYDEDVDLGLKIRRAGWKIAFVPEAAVYHYFLKRPRAPATKATAFRDGRNRAILLVRNYGVSVRLVLFFLTAPWVRLWEATRCVARQCATSYGHWFAYLAGIAAGLVTGIRNPPGRDKAMD